MVAAQQYTKIAQLSTLLVFISAHPPLVWNADPFTAVDIDFFALFLLLFSMA